MYRHTHRNTSIFKIWDGVLAIFALYQWTDTFESWTRNESITDKLAVLTSTAGLYNAVYKFHILYSRQKQIFTLKHNSLKKWRQIVFNVEIFVVKYMSTGTYNVAWIWGNRKALCLKLDTGETQYCERNCLACRPLSENEPSHEEFKYYTSFEVIKQGNLRDLK